jgi:hypothetical protein
VLVQPAVLALLYLQAIAILHPIIFFAIQSTSQMYFFKLKE